VAHRVVQIGATIRASSVTRLAAAAPHLRKFIGAAIFIALFVTLRRPLGLVNLPVIFVS